MVDDKASPFAGAVVDCIAVISSLAGANRVAPLPEHVAGHTFAGEGSGLPWRLDGHMVASCAILF